MPCYMSEAPTSAQKVPSIFQFLLYIFCACAAQNDWKKACSTFYKPSHLSILHLIIMTDFFKGNSPIDYVTKGQGKLIQYVNE
jgi:hypothetical protein